MTLTLLWLAACLGDPVGPHGLVSVQPVGPDSLQGAPGRPLPPVALRVQDGGGRPVAGASVAWTVVAGQGRVEQAGGITDGRGVVSAQWVLGTKAGDPQRLVAQVRVGGHHAEVSFSAVPVPVEIAAVEFLAETTEVRLGLPIPLRAEAVDPFGNRFVPSGLRFRSLDSSIVVADSADASQPGRRGYARVVASVGGYADTAWVHVIQVVRSIVAPDTIRFFSIGQRLTLDVRLVDDQGFPVLDSLPSVLIEDTSLVGLSASGALALQSRRNGVAAIRVQVGAVGRTVTAVVEQIVAALTLPVDSLHFDALRDTSRLVPDARDSLGVAVADPRLLFFSSDTIVAHIDAMGTVTARANGAAVVGARTSSGVASTVPVGVRQEVAVITSAQDTLPFDALGAVRPVGAVARDRLGYPVAGATLTYTVGDTAIVSVDANGQVRARANGTTALTVGAGGSTATIVVRVAQRPFRVALPRDTVRLDALGAEAAVAAVALDSLGSPVDSAVANLQVTDPSVASVVAAGTVQARANGLTTATFTVAGLSGQVTIVVAQVAVRLTAAVISAQPIVSVASGTPLALSCQAYDRNDSLVAQDPVVSAARVGPPGSCSHFPLTRSGRDTLSVSVGNALELVPVTVALLPGINSPEGDTLVTDSIPARSDPTVVSARRNSRGAMELYVAMQVDTLSYAYEDLHRYASDDDGATFHYDGVVLRHDSTGCSPLGFGMEHVAIAPRADGPGWRMFFAGGQFYCYGWQVFSAVSSDERNWTIEPGVRLPNSLNGQLSKQYQRPWPVGEGIVVDRLPDGTWRLIVGGMEHIDPWEDKWQIVEWRSSDQLNWTYSDTLLTTRQLPPEGQASVYSPTISEFAPGLWRMFFTADNRYDPDGRFRIWSAVSTDQRTWQVEGPMVQSDRYNYYYGSLVGDLLVMMRRGSNGTRHLAATRVQMP